ncbi:MAG TPA: NAD(P)-binding domain-containing protein [Vicinamibacteria bacterium]
MRIAVIGAGPSGITAAKNLLQAGLREVVVYDRNPEVGGNWIYSPEPSHSSVFETTHIISSRTLSEYEDYPWPQDACDYPGHLELRAYFQGYARHFGVVPLIRFRTEVRRAERAEEGRAWKLTLGSGEQERFDHLVVASGHHWDPRWPEYPGRFAGESIHSHDFKQAERFRGRRVLVIGGGNSACDIAVETARVSAATAISMRRGYYFVPKFLFGLPSDLMHARFEWIPRPLRAALLRVLLWASVGDFERYGLEKPDHEFMASHPVVNSELLYFIRHGRIRPRRDIARFDGHTVHFTDGRSEDYDVLIACTGFKISFPFFERSLVDFSSGPVPLYLRAFHPRIRNLFFVGLFQPVGCIWPLADLQAKLIANLLAGRYRLPEDVESRIRDLNEVTERTFMDTPRHTLEVDYHPFRRALLRQVPKDAPSFPREDLVS